MTEPVRSLSVSVHLSFPVQVAQKKLAAFLALMPYEPLAVAKGQLEARGSIE